MFIDRIFRIWASLSAITILIGCSQIEPSPRLTDILNPLTSKTGKQKYLKSPYVTAGDRLYMVGHQDGSFPDLGSHVKGEMGGIWAHPIKLMDGFMIAIHESRTNKVKCLNDAYKFVNYPLANKIFLYKNKDISIERTQFVPDGEEGLVVELNLHNTTDDHKSVKLYFTGMVDLLPVWLSNRLGISNGTDEASWDSNRKLYVSKDSENDWYTIFGSDAKTDSAWQASSPCPIKRKGKGLNATISSKIQLDANSSRSIRYFIAGSSKSEKEALQNYHNISTNPVQLLENKIERYEKIKAQSELTIPNKKIQEMYTWMKYNSDWLIGDVEGVGRGLYAAIPDYPWWFGIDNEYALQGLLGIGWHKEVQSTIDLLYQKSQKENGNGRIIHEVTTNGVVYNKGNINETALFIWLVWKTYQWTADKEFLSKYYYNQVKEGLNWLLNERDKDGDLYPSGYGIMETSGLNFELIDVAVYTQQALQAASFMAKELNDDEKYREYKALSDSLSRKINTQWWLEDFDSYADLRATKKQALLFINDLIDKKGDQPWVIKKLQNSKKRIQSEISSGENSYLIQRNWVVNTPMEMGVADTGKAEKALETAREYSNKYGMFIRGIAKREKRISEEFQDGGPMTISTAVQAVAEANYGHSDESYEYLKQLSNSFGYLLPGSMYELSPNDGNMVQSWSIYSVVAIIEYFFGITPKAYNKQVEIKPQMPSSWNNASLKNVKIGTNLIGISKTTEGKVISYILTQKKKDWDIRFELPGNAADRISVNGKSIKLKKQNGQIRIDLSGSQNKVKLFSK